MENITLSKKKRSLKLLCIITVLCCLLTTIIHAEYKQEFNDKMASFRLWGRITADGADAWREITITEQETGVYKTAYYPYLMQRQRAVFAFPQQIVVDNLYLQYTFVLNEDIYSTGNIQFSDNVEQIAYTVQDYGPNAATAWFPNGTITSEKSVKNNEIKYTFTYDGDAKLMRSIRAFTSITTVSTDYIIKDIKLVINDKEFKIVNTAIKDMESASNDLNDVVSDIPDVTVSPDINDKIDNALDSMQVSNEYNSFIISIGDNSAVTYIMTMSCILALISYVLYGKKHE